MLTLLCEYPYILDNSNSHNNINESKLIKIHCPNVSFLIFCILNTLNTGSRYKTKPNSWLVRAQKATASPVLPTQILIDREWFL